MSEQHHHFREETPDSDDVYNEAERTDVGHDDTDYKGTTRDETHVDQTGYKGVTRGVVHREDAQADGRVVEDREH